MNYKAIIFDMDGTIIDTEHIWKKANKVLIERRGIEYTNELHHELSQKLGSLALHQSCAIIKEIACLDDHLDHLIREKRILAQDLYSAEVRFIEGFISFHGRAIGHNLVTAIATNADEHIVHAANQAVQLERFFGQHIYSVSSVGNIGKPRPDIYFHAANKLGINPKECIVVEDSANGIKAAKAAGMHCIGINTAKNRHSLRESDVIIEHYDDIDLVNLLGLKKVE